MPDSHHFSIAKLTVPIGMVTTIIGGSAWLATTRADVSHLDEKVKIHIVDFKKNELKVQTTQQKHGEIISRTEAKIDIMLKTMQSIERRVNSNSSRSRPPPPR